MEVWQVKHIRRNLPDLIETTTCTVMLLAILRARGVLGDAEMKSLRYGQKSDMERNYQLYQILMTREGTYTILMDALQETRQFGALDILRGGININYSGTRYNRNTKRALFANLHPAIDRLLDAADANILLISTIDKKLSLRCIKEADRDDLVLHDAKSGPIQNQLEQLHADSALVCDWAQIGGQIRQFSGINKKVIIFTEDEINEIKHGIKHINPKPEVATEVFHWTKLSKDAQSWIQQYTVSFQNRIINLNQLPKSSVPFDELGGKFLVDLLNHEIPVVVNNSCPTIPSYYIPRDIVSSRNISREVFKNTKTDVLVVRGLQLFELAKLVKPKDADKSSNQIQQLTTQYIQLETEAHFDKICQISPDPVHLLTYEKGQFMWSKSNGSVKLILAHIHHDQPWVKEDEFIKQCNESNDLVCLTDSHGMGKTIFLAQLARQIMNRNPDSVIRFAQFNEFIKDFNEKTVTEASMCKQIAKLSSTYDFGKQLVINMLKAEDIRCHVFLDGYDEIFPDQIKMADQIIKVVTNLKNTKLYVTTRPHMRRKLELMTGTLAYQLMPFKEQDEVNFLVGVWKQEGAVETKTLKRFAISCLDSLKARVTRAEIESCGTPIQCYMLAKINVELAMKYSKTGISTHLQPPSSEPSSLFEMYAILMEQAFRRFQARANTQSWLEWFLNVVKIKKSVQDVMRHAHMYYAIEQLYPSLKSDFEKLHPPNVSSNPLLYVPGLLEMDVTHSYPRFVQRTFAEYSVALFVVEFVGRWHTFKQKPSFYYLLARILATRKSYEKACNMSFQLNTEASSLLPLTFENPVLCYFLNYLIKSHDIVEELRQTVAISSLIARKFVDIYNAAIVNNYSELAAVFDDLVTAATSLPWADLLLLAATYSTIELCERLGELMRIKCSQLICEMDYPVIKSRYKVHFMATPLHVAMSRGNLQLTMFLLNQGGFAKLLTQKSKKTKYLLHCCLGFTECEARSVINEKIEIIRMLFTSHQSTLCAHMLEEKAYCGLTPFLQENVNAELMKCLIELGADVNACDDNGRCVLHLLPTYGRIAPSDYHRLLEFLIKSDFHRYNDKLPDSHYQTPMTQAITQLGANINTVNLFVQQGANINQVDEYGNSVFFNAINSARPRKFLEQLVESGADPAIPNNQGQSALHLAVQTNNMEVLTYLIETTNILDNVDLRRNNALHAGMEWSGSYEISTEILIKLVSAGVDLTAVNNKGHTPFMYGLACGKRYSLLVTKHINDKLKNGLEVFANKCLKCMLINEKLEWDDDAMCGAECFIVKGAVLKGSSIDNPWLLKQVTENIGKIVETTKCTTELLSMVTPDAHGLDNSHDLYAYLKCMPGTYERMMLAMIKTKQIRPLQLLRESLRKDQEASSDFLVPSQELIKFLGGKSTDAGVLILQTTDTYTTCKKMRDTLCIDPRIVDQMPSSVNTGVEFLLCSSEKELVQIINNWSYSRKLVCIIKSEDENEIKYLFPANPRIHVVHDEFIVDDISRSVQSQIQGLPCTQAFAMNNIIPFVINPKIPSVRLIFRYAEQYYPCKIWTRSNKSVDLAKIIAQGSCVKLVSAPNPFHVRQFVSELRWAHEGTSSMHFVKFEHIFILVSKFLETNDKFHGSAAQLLLDSLGLLRDKTNLETNMELLVMLEHLSTQKAQLAKLKDFGDMVARKYKNIRVWVFSDINQVTTVEKELGTAAYELKSFCRTEIVEAIRRFSDSDAEGIKCPEEVANACLKAYENKVQQYLPVFPIEITSDWKVNTYNPAENPMLYSFLLANKLRKSKFTEPLPIESFAELSQDFINQQSVDLLRTLAKSYFPEWLQILNKGSGIESNDLNITLGLEKWNASHMHVVKIDIVSLALARLLVDEKSRHHLNQEYLPQFMENIVFSVERISRNNCAFKYASLVCFINVCLGENVCRQYFLNILRAVKLERVSKEAVIRACVFGSCVNILKLVVLLEEGTDKLFGEELLGAAITLADKFTLEFVCDQYNKLPRKKITNVRSYTGDMSLVQLAVYRGDYSVTEYLVKYQGFDTQITLFKNDLLHICVRNTTFDNERLIDNKIKIIHMLVHLKHGLINETDKDGSTPLLMWNIHLEILKLLISLNANVNATDRNGDGLLHIAAKYLPWGQYHELIKLILDINQEALLIHKNNNGHNLLTLAPLHRSPQEYHNIVQLLLDNNHQTPFRQRTNNESSVLVCAMDLELKEETLQLLVNQVDINELNDNANNALMIAIAKGRNAEFMDMMIRHGADSKIRNENLFNVLHYAAMYGNLSALQFFLSRGEINVNEKSNDGSTPLHLAFVSPNQFTHEIVMHLVEVGAYTDINNDAGKTAFDLAWNAVKNNQLDNNTVIEMTRRVPTYASASMKPIQPFQLPSLKHLNYASDEDIPKPENISGWIRQNLFDLVNLTKCTPSLISRLNGYGILWESDIKILTEKGISNCERALHMYELLDTRYNAYELLLKALLLEKQTKAYQILQQAKNKLSHSKTLFVSSIQSISEFLTNDIENILVINTNAREICLKRIQDTMQGKLIIHDFRSRQLVAALNELPDGNALVINAKKLGSALFKIRATTKKVILLTELKISEIDQITRSLKLNAVIDEEKMCWGDLHQNARHIVLNQPVLIQAEVKLIKELLPAALQVNKISGKLLFDLLNGRCPDLIKNNVPELPRLYLRRRILVARRISEDIFKNEDNDVFVFNGIPLKELANLAAGQQVVSSAKYEKGSKSRFIQLQAEEHFNTICELTRNPLHWISYDDGHLTWVKSRGSTEAISRYIVYNQQQVMNEEQFVREYISSKNSVCIADGSGKGKSVLLAKIGSLLMQENPEFVVVHVVLRELISEFTQVTQDSVCKLITNLSSDYELGRKYVLRALTSGEIKCFLLLDGHGETPTRHEYQVKKLIQYLRNLSLEDTHLIITTRLENQGKINVLINNPSRITTADVDYEDQINALVNFWSDHGAESNSQLSEFANACLTNLKANMTDFEAKLAGSHFSCQLIARSCCYDAIKYSKLGFEPDRHPPNDIAASLHELYEPYVTFSLHKLQRFFAETRKKGFLWFPESGSSLLEKVKRAHMYYALKEVYPEKSVWFESKLMKNVSGKLKSFLQSQDESLHQSHTCNNNPRFVHKSVGQYIVGTFVVQCMGFKSREFRKSYINFLFEAILETANAKYDIMKPTAVSNDEPYFLHSPTFLEDNRSVCFFLNARLISEKTLVKQNLKMDNWWAGQSPNLTQPLSASVLYEFQGITSFMMDLIKMMKPEEINWPQLFLLASRYCDENIMEDLSQNLKHFTGLPLHQLDYGEINPNSQFVVTPLHVAVRRGKVNLSRFLLKEGFFCNQLQEENNDRQYFLQACIFQSSQDAEPILQNKKKIIELLREHMVDSHLIELKITRSTPEIGHNMHKELLDYLVHHENTNQARGFSESSASSLVPDGTDNVKCGGPLAQTSVAQIPLGSHFMALSKHFSNIETKLVVETEGYSIRNIVRILRECSTAEVAYRDWKQVAQTLSVEKSKIIQIEDKLFSNRCDHAGAYGEILEQWKSSNGTEATVECLIDALQQCRLTDLADSINLKLIPPSVHAMREIGKMVRCNALWKKLGERRGWIRHFYETDAIEHGSDYYPKLRSEILQDIQNIETCWRSGEPTVRTIKCNTGLSSRVNCFQCDDWRIVSGLSNGAINILDRATFNCIKTIQHHTSAISSLGLNNNVIVGGDTGGVILVMDIGSGEILKTLDQQTCKVRNLRIYKSVMVTCSESEWITAVWDMTSIKNIKLRKQLMGHTGDVMDVAVDDKHIFSASQDKTIKIWDSKSYKLARTLVGHAEGVSCIDICDGRVVSGSDDKTIRIWNVENGTCDNVLKFENLLTCLRLDKKRIVCGDRNGEIKIWDIESLCSRSLHKHTAAVGGIQFDDFQIISCSNDGTMMHIWDFDSVDNN